MVVRRMKCLWLLVFCILVSGCIFHSAPPDNVGFLSVESLRELEGVFRNLGESDAERQPVYLSSLIWKSSDIAHSAITAVEVRVPDAESLIVRALRDDKIEKEDIFVRERDFRIRHGRIQLNRQWALLNYGSGDPLVGPRYESYEIGLDAKGDGKYRSHGAGAGLIFLFFPVAISDTQEVRFIRLEQ
ncbi:MAG TPA: hypothetical protein VD811_14705 [Desulfuromonadales bacterium]|nr:hypothetical protein [Desulfuromonadales bacterium]